MKSTVGTLRMPKRLVSSSLSSTSHLPQELQEVFSDELLYYFLDLLVEYLVESGLLEAEGDADGYVEIDQEAISDHLAKKAAREKMGDFSAEDLCFVVQAMLDFEMGEDE